jgi:hypothetical protein
VTDVEINLLRRRIQETVGRDPQQFIENIPPGSGICHIANVGQDQWNPGFVSTRSGRWSENGQPSRYFADDFKVCAAELGHAPENPPVGKTFELWETAREIPAINVARLPDDIRGALFEDFGPAPDKWAKPYAFLEEVKKIPGLEGVGCVYAPSASGQMLGMGGMCFMANPLGPDVRRVSVGNYEDWVQGRFDRT